jgi:hypothetical protein
MSLMAFGMHSFRSVRLVFFRRFVFGSICFCEVDVVAGHRKEGGKSRKLDLNIHFQGIDTRLNDGGGLVVVQRRPLASSIVQTSDEYERAWWLSGFPTECHFLLP